MADEKKFKCSHCDGEIDLAVTRRPKIGCAYFCEVYPCTNCGLLHFVDKEKGIVSPAEFTLPPQRGFLTPDGQISFALPSSIEEWKE